MDPAVHKGDVPRLKDAATPASASPSISPDDAPTSGTGGLLQATGEFFENIVGGVGDTLEKQGWVNWHEYRGTCATLHLHTRQMLDVTLFAQDATNVAQIGQASDQFQWREARFYISGRFLCFVPAWSYSISLDYGGFSLPQSERFGISEAWIAIPVNDWIGTVEVGKVRQTFSLESLTSGGSLTFMERALDAFYLGNLLGLAFRNAALDERIAWSGGFYDDWSGGNAYIGGAARITGLPVEAKDAEVLLHLGASARYMSTSGKALDFQARPATKVGPWFADTGAFAASDTWSFDAEALAILGPATLQAEFLETWTTSPQTGNPHFWGWYVKAAWFVTGERPPYERMRAIPGYVVPNGKWGAVELAARWWVNDLNGGNLAGGVLRDLQVGASWYVGAWFRLDFNYGHAWLDRFGAVGQSGVYGFRLQLQI